MTTKRLSWIALGVKRITLLALLGWMLPASQAWLTSQRKLKTDVGSLDGISIAGVSHNLLERHDYTAVHLKHIL
eukprot:scaffold515925_cov47-Prasinocladus_malaysianus.AAC.1